MSDLNNDLKRVMNEETDFTLCYDPEDIARNKSVCALSYLSILFFLPLVVCPDSKFGRFHANQALALLITAIVGNVLFRVSKIILSILHLGWIAGMAGWFWSLLVFLLMIFGIVNVLNGRAKELPVIGKIKIIR